MLLALDMSTKSTGQAIFDEDKLVRSGCFTASSTNVRKRIKKIMCDLKSVLDIYTIDAIIAEEVLPENSKDLKSLRTQKVLMWLQGALELLIYDYNDKIKIEYVYPSEWRSSCGIHTGRGIKRADLKPADIAFVKEKFNLDANDDEADAIGIGYFATHKTELQEINWE